MKKNIFFHLGYTAFFLIMTAYTLAGQQQTIEYQSDSQDLGNGTNGPHLLLMQTGDADGFARIFFKNSADPDPLNRWSFLGRPQDGAMDNDGILTQPMVMAHRAAQVFGFGSDGTLRINRQFTLPNMDGGAGEVMTTDGNGVVSWQPVGGSGIPDTLMDADMDSYIHFIEGVGNSIDTMEVNMAGPGGTFKVFRFTNNVVQSNRRMTINANSSPTAPTLRLTESGGSDAARLFFTNEDTGNNWIIAANGGSNAANVRHAVNYNGENRYVYDEQDSVLTVLNEVTAFANSNDGSTFSFANNQFSNNRFRIIGDPSNTNGENASMHFDWKGTTLERDFMTFTADGGGVQPVVEFHQDMKYGNDPTPTNDIRLEVFSDQNMSGGQTGIRSKVVNNDPSAAQTYGIVGMAESSTSSARGIWVEAVTSGANDDAFGIYGEANATGAGANEYGLYGSASGTAGSSFALFANGNIWYTGSVTAPSDRRLKKNISDLPKTCLDKIMRLEPKSYEYDNALVPHMNFAQGLQLGFLAQDVQKIIPEAVQVQSVTNAEPKEASESTEKVEILGMDYSKLFPVLTGAIQEQQEQIKQLLAENEAFRNELNNMKSLISSNKK